MKPSPIKHPGWNVNFDVVNAKTSAAFRRGQEILDQFKHKKEAVSKDQIL